MLMCVPSDLMCCLSFTCVCFMSVYIVSSFLSTSFCPRLLVGFALKVIFYSCYQVKFGKMSQLRVVFGEIKIFPEVVFSLNFSPCF